VNEGLVRTKKGTFENNTKYYLRRVCGVALTSPALRAVSPPPDGGYPGGNTAEGDSALLALSTGSYNTAIGWFSQLDVTSGEFNTAVGAATLVTNTADDKTAVGTGALFLNTIGEQNAGLSRAGCLRKLNEILSTH
jgi:hypothetical protein